MKFWKSFRSYEMNDARMNEMNDARLNEILKDGKRFITRNWTSKPLLKLDIIHVEENPGLIKNCPAMIKFKEMLKLHTDAMKNSIFAWHGTSELAVPLICHHGFDPLKRISDSCRDYFGRSHDVSLGYSQRKSSNRMILVLLVNCSGQTYIADTFCTAQNTSTVAYALPLFVITYSDVYVYNKIESKVPFIWIPDIKTQSPIFNQNISNRSKKGKKKSNEEKSLSPSLLSSTPKNVIQFRTVSSFTPSYTRSRIFGIAVTLLLLIFYMDLCTNQLL